MSPVLQIAVGGEGGAGRRLVAPIAADVGGRADRDLAALARRQMAVALAQYGELDDRPVRPAGRGGLVVIIGPEIAAADRIGLGEAVAQRRLGAREAVLEPLDVRDRARRAAGGDVGQRGEVVFVAVGMLHQLEAHRRHADEIGDLLLLDQPQRLARIPFRHQHHGPADDEAVEQHRHLAGDVEQGHVDQGLGRVRRRLAVALLDAEQGRRGRSYRHRRRW